MLFGIYTEMETYGVYNTTGCLHLCNATTRPDSRQLHPKAVPSADVTNMIPHRAPRPQGVVDPWSKPVLQRCPKHRAVVCFSV